MPPFLILNFSETVAVRIVATTPKRFAGIGAFLGKAFKHRLAAFGAYRCVFRKAFSCTLLQPFRSECLRKSALGGKRR